MKRRLRVRMTPPRSASSVSLRGRTSRRRQQHETHPLHHADLVSRLRHRDRDCAGGRSGNVSEHHKSPVNFSELLISLLTTLFVGLKLTGHIDWHWVWVLAPLW